MRKIEIDETFKQAYLTCGETYDYFIFENCLLEFLCDAEKLLIIPKNSVKPCNVKLTRQDEIKIEKTLENCVNDLQKDMLARDFVTALVMQQVLKDVSEEGESYNRVCEQIKAFLQNEYSCVKQYHATSFFPYEIAEYSKRYGKIELNFFLIETQSKVIQKAINNFISSREPYSVKLFTTNSKLPSYVDQAGNYMQAPHDYMNVNVDKFINLIDDCSI